MSSNERKKTRIKELRKKLIPFVKQLVVRVENTKFEAQWKIISSVIDNNK